MKAYRLHIGLGLSELSNYFIYEDLMKESKIRSLGIKSTVLAHYIILSSEFHSNL